MNITIIGAGSREFGPATRDLFLSERICERQSEWQCSSAGRPVITPQTPPPSGAWPHFPIVETGPQPGTGIGPSDPRLPV